MAQLSLNMLLSRCCHKLLYFELSYPKPIRSSSSRLRHDGVHPLNTTIKTIVNNIATNNNAFMPFEYKNYINYHLIFILTLNHHIMYAQEVKKNFLTLIYEKYTQNTHRRHEKHVKHWKQKV